MTDKKTTILIVVAVVIILVLAGGFAILRKYNLIPGQGGDMVAVPDSGSVAPPAENVPPRGGIAESSATPPVEPPKIDPVLYTSATGKILSINGDSFVVERVMPLAGETTVKVIVSSGTRIISQRPNPKYDPSKVGPDGTTTPENTTVIESVISLKDLVAGEQIFAQGDAPESGGELHASTVLVSKK